MEERPGDQGVGGSVRALQCTGTRLPSHLHYLTFRYFFPLFVLYLVPPQRVDAARTALVSDACVGSSPRGA